MNNTNQPTAKHQEQARERLKPCPFCSGEAILLEDDVSEYPADGKVYHVTCLDSCSVAPGVYAQAAAEEAIQKWNARTEGNALCQPHATEFSVFYVGGCLKCWNDSEIASALSSCNTQIREVLEMFPWRNNSEGMCWCWKGEHEQHAAFCLAAKALWETVKE